MATKSKTTSKPKTKKIETKTNQPTADKPKTETKVEAKTNASHRNLVIIIIVAIFGLLLIAGSAVLSFMLLPQTTNETDQVAVTEPETVVYPPANVNQPTESTETTDEKQAEAENENKTEKPASTSTSTTNKTTNQSGNKSTTSATKKPTVTSFKTNDGSTVTQTTTTVNGITYEHYQVSGGNSQSNSSNSSSSSSQPVVFSRSNCKDKSQVTVTKYMVAHHVEDEEKILEEGTKYGVGYITRQMTFYQFFNNGACYIETSTQTYYKNREKFNATTAQLKPEAIQQKSAQRAKINQILATTNQYRAEKGLAPLTLDEDLTTAAEIRAIEMRWADKFDHYRPNGTLYNTVTTDLGIPRALGENIVGNTSGSVSQMMTDWRNSTGHYNNMINPNFTKIGIGYYVHAGWAYAVQLFR